MAATATEQSSNAEEISVVGDAWLGLPESVRAALSPDGRRPTADTLDCLFADAADRRDFLAGFAADADELQLLLRLMLHLEAGSAQQALLCRKRRAREDPAMQFLAVELKRRAMACAPAVESYQWLVSCSHPNNHSPPVLGDVSPPKSKAVGLYMKLGSCRGGAVNWRASW